MKKSISILGLSYEEALALIERERAYCELLEIEGDNATMNAIVHFIGTIRGLRMYSSMPGLRDGKGNQLSPFRLILSFA